MHTYILCSCVDELHLTDSSSWVRMWMKHLFSRYSGWSVIGIIIWMSCNVDVFLTSDSSGNHWVSQELNGVSHSRVEAVSNHSDPTGKFISQERLQCYPQWDREGLPILSQVEWLCWLVGLGWSGRGLFVWFCFITSLDVSPNYCEMSLASVFPGLCGLAAENKVNSSFSPFVHLGRFGMG